MVLRIRPACISNAITAPIRLRRKPFPIPSRPLQLSIWQRPLSTTSTDSTPTPEPLQMYIPANTHQNPEDPSGPHFEPLSYFVHRTPSQQLPIYHLAKRGGNKHQTRIRKISGSIESLRDDLKRELGLGEKEIAINSVNGHIVIKGWRKIEVAKFLLEKKF